MQICVKIQKNSVSCWEIVVEDPGKTGARVAASECSMVTHFWELTSFDLGQEGRLQVGEGENWNDHVG